MTIENFASSRKASPLFKIRGLDPERLHLKQLFWVRALLWLIFRTMCEFSDQGASYYLIIKSYDNSLAILNEGFFSSCQRTQTQFSSTFVLFYLELNYVWAFFYNKYFINIGKVSGILYQTWEGYSADINP